MQIPTYGCRLIDRSQVYGHLQHRKDDPFRQSILWDLGIPQEAATILYEDNDACTAMGNAQMPTPPCAAATRIHAPLKADYAGNPWLIVLWNDHGLYNP